MGTQSPTELISIVVQMFPTFNARAVVVLSANLNGYRHQGQLKSTAFDLPQLWANYIELCRTNTEPLSRSLRLKPHPIALSDLRRHPRLLLRSQKLIHLLAQYELNDAFLVPAIDQQLNAAIVMIVGRNLSLRPNRCHLMTQAAADVVMRLQAPAAAPSFNPPPHLQLTARQLEIGAWLIAGKTDWEIGEILQISTKTVNFHVENIKRAYGVKSRNQFVAAIVHAGGLTPHPVSSRVPGSTGELSST
jgi:LuxR family quorum sensing-dependent transcriptional regulator